MVDTLSIRTRSGTLRAGIKPGGPKINKYGLELFAESRLSTATRPSASIAATEILGGAFGQLAYVGLNGMVPSIAVLSTKPSKRVLRLIFNLLSALDAATESVGGRLRDWFATQRSIEGFAQFARSHLSIITRVVDPSAIEQLVGAIEKVGFWSNGSAEAIGDLVSGILQNGE